jgi:hypothetical protein
MRLTDEMSRSGPARLLVTIVAALVLAVGSGSAAASTGTDGSDDPTPVTVTDFYPENNDLSDCVGLVERPGCGSEARGGWRQTVTFALLAPGLGLIFWRVAVGVRNNRRE